MARLSPDCVWRRIVIDTRLPAKARIIALEQIARPSLNLLRRLLSQKTTPPRLRLLASKYAAAIAEKEVRKASGYSEDGHATCGGAIDRQIAELCSGIVSTEGLSNRGRRQSNRNGPR
ncbi:MAG TPA: hypothetical protein VNO32_47805 [Candidatus Acidoferrum sp.]|nr:hypothetical protein [Candidatus Acidoferrum sp.]